MKKKGNKKLPLVFVLLTLAIALGGCAGDKQDNNSSKITIGIPQDLEKSLDPHIAEGAGTKEVLFNLYEGLMKTDSNGNLYPAIASDYAIDEEGKVYTFTLRPQVKFHDGSVVTAEDVKHSIDKCADTSNGSPLVSAYADIAEVKILEDTKVEIILKAPNTEFLAYMTTPILPKSNPDPNTNPIGTGPYRYVSRSPQENFVVKRFEEYWGEKAKIENVIFKVVANADTIVMNLQGGSIDMYARITASQASQLGEEFNIEEGTMNLVQALYLNHEKAPFDNEKVRQALCYAIDPKEIMMLISEGKGQQIGSSMFPSFGKYYMEELNNLYNKDTAKAKELLKEAGFENGFSFEITVPSNHQPHIDTAQVIVEQLKAIGVDATIRLIEWDSWLSEVYTNRNYDSTVVGVDASNLTARALLERFSSTADNNFTNYKNPEYDAALEKAMSCVDQEEQIEYYKTCETILSETAANVYIQDMPEFVAIHKRYGGYEFYPLYVQDISKIYLVEEQ